MVFLILGAYVPADGRRCSRCDAVAERLREARLGAQKWLFCQICVHDQRQAFGVMVKEEEEKPSVR